MRIQRSPSFENAMKVMEQIKAEKEQNEKEAEVLFFYFIFLKRHESCGAD